jgi:hypothetical protein
MKRLVPFGLTVLVAFAAGIALGLSWRGKESSATPPVVSRSVSSAPVKNSAPANAPANVSEDERSATSRALQRLAAGDYVLSSEIPITRRANEEQVEKAAALAMQRREADYTDLFAALGLDAKTSAQLKHHLLQIYRAKVEASQALGQLAQAEDDFDRRARQVMDGKYAVFRADEEAYPARREVERFQEFAAGAGVPLTATQKTQLQQLIGESKAYSFGTLSEWGGPYQDPIPPAAGPAVVTLLETQLARMQERSAQLSAAAEKSGFDDSTRAALKNYFAAQIAETSGQLAAARDPLVAAIQHYEQQIAAMKAKDAADPRIRTFEARIANLKAQQAAKTGR